MMAGGEMQRVFGPLTEHVELRWTTLHLEGRRLLLKTASMRYSAAPISHVNTRSN